MSELIVRDIPATELAALQARAQRHGHSCEDEVLHLIHRAVQEEQLVEQLEQAQAAVEARLRRIDPLLGPRRRRHSPHNTPTPASEAHR